MFPKEAVPKEYPLIILDPYKMPLPTLNVSINAENYPDLILLAKAKELQYVFVAMYKPGTSETANNPYSTGVIARIKGVNKEETTLLVHCESRAKLLEIKESDPEFSYNLAVVGDILEDDREEAFRESGDGQFTVAPGHASRIRAFRNSLKYKMDKLLDVCKDFKPDKIGLLGAIYEDFENLDTTRRDVLDQLVWLTIFAMPYMEAPLKQRFIESKSLMSRLGWCIGLLEINIQTNDATKKIEAISKSRLVPIRTSEKTPSDNLGDKGGDNFSTNNPELHEKYIKYLEIKKSISDKEERSIFTEAAMKDLKRLKNFENVGSDKTEVAMINTHLDWILAWPWGKESPKRNDIGYFEQVFESEHFGLRKAEDKISRGLAVKIMNPNSKSEILCFVGPSGVGKTSVGQSIAKGLGREYVRISLGGVKDEAEIRGHRVTFIGSYPGNIVKGICAAKTKNPVFVLDEIDKIVSDFRGDAAAALLEVLDPEQNNTFVDHYMDIPLDLSKALFICTANNILDISPALRDRMDIIYFSGYTEEAKVQIAKRFIFPKILTKVGLAQVNFVPKWQNDDPDEGLLTIVRGYTKEAGVRDLERKLFEIGAEIVREDLKNPGYADNVVINEQLIKKIHGHSRAEKSKVNETKIGEAIGLAWTELGGKTMYVQAAIIPTDSKTVFSQTGQLGSIMREADKIALSLLRIRLADLGKTSLLEGKLIHLHIPEGSIPKDGPSAGITAYFTLESAALKKVIRRRLAMTGEINLVGMVTGVGGIKEKVIAAANSGIEEIILPESNREDYEEEAPQYAKDKFHNVYFVNSIEQAREIIFPPA